MLAKRISTLWGILDGCCLQVVNAGGSLWMQFIEYNNPDGEGSNGHCCDGRGVACQSDGCDHYFEICVTNR